MNAFTFRLDVKSHDGKMFVSVTEEEVRKRIEDTLEEGKFTKYMISWELSEKKQKYHYQGIIFDDRKDQAFKKWMDARFPEWCGNRGIGSGSKRSFAPCKDVPTYESYIRKDNDIRFINGYTEQEISAITPWVAKDVWVSTQKKKSEKTWFQMVKEHAFDRGVRSGSEAHEFIAAVIDAYTLKCSSEPSDVQVVNYAKSILRQMVYEDAVASGNLTAYENYIRKRAKMLVPATWTPYA